MRPHLDEPIFRCGFCILLLLTVLTVCRLAGKNIGDAGAKAIAQALRTNTTVQKLALYGTSADESLSLLEEVRSWRASC